MREIARVLKPGGRVLLADIQRSREYAAVVVNGQIDATGNPFTS